MKSLHVIMLCFGVFIYNSMSAQLSVFGAFEYSGQGALIGANDPSSDNRKPNLGYSIAIEYGFSEQVSSQLCYKHLFNYPSDYGIYSLGVGNSRYGPYLLDQLDVEVFYKIYTSDEFSLDLAVGPSMLIIGNEFGEKYEKALRFSYGVSVRPVVYKYFFMSLAYEAYFSQFQFGIGMRCKVF